ncbi:methyltransferase family protein [uncultured Helicobacter sp.]|uniref:methyltransferase family protein n=1 Tax=uncultured Helicobacter sp. TaxID=175537 RepID=UPI00374EB931
MVLKDNFKKEGDFLFRYRSYLPLVVIPLFVLCLLSFPQNLLLPRIQMQELFFLNVFVGTGAELNFVYNTPLVVCAIIIGLLGQFIRILVAGYVPRDTSGRNTKAQKAEVLNTTGMYSLCRNPLYLGNFLMMLSPVLLLGNWLFALCFTLAFWLYYERIIYAEESFLTQKFGDAYLRWAQNTPAFVPSFRNYTKSTLGFSMKSMLKREYHSLFGLAASLFLIHWIISAYVLWDFVIVFEPLISALFVLSAVIYIVMLVLVKTTKIFEVEGR